MSNPILNHPSPVLLDTLDALDPIPNIRNLWSTDTLLPPTLPLPPDPSPEILAALFSLAKLTPAQPERAWNLLSTYFHARIRKASYTGRGGGRNGVYAVLEEEDVLKACGSVRRMSVGMDMEGGVNRRDSTSDGVGSVNASESETCSKVTSKRKWSIGDEINNAAQEEVNTGAKRTRRFTSSCTAVPSPSPPNRSIHIHTRDDTDGLPPLPAILDMHPRPEARIELPPIYTLTGREEHRISLERLIEAARGASREMSLRKREVEGAVESVRVAKEKYWEAKILAEKLKMEVMRAEGLN